MKHLVIGLGEVGIALQKILECDGYDEKMEDTLMMPGYDVLHICFPYGKEFESFVRLYQKWSTAKYTVIHSTVPVGTSRKLNATHSPIRGVHPHLEGSIRTFVKYFSGEEAEIVSQEFLENGLPCKCFPNQETTELMKLVDTTSYGINILIQKEIKRLCDENNVEFDDVYTHANQTYNDGYEELGMPQFKKYILEHRDGTIGGHCILPNAKLLDSWMNDLLCNHSSN